MRQIQMKVKIMHGRASAFRAPFRRAGLLASLSQHLIEIVGNEKYFTGNALTVHELQNVKMLKHHSTRASSKKRASGRNLYKQRSRGSWRR